MFNNEAPNQQQNAVNQSHQHESDFEDLYQDYESLYNYVDSPYNFGANHHLNYPKFYDDLMVRKWERVISEENVDDEECKER